MMMFSTLICLSVLGLCKYVLGERCQANVKDGSKREKRGVEKSRALRLGRVGGSTQ